MATITTIPLATGERAAADAVLAAIGRHFTMHQGSQRAAYDAMTEDTPIAPGVRVNEAGDGPVGGWWLRPADAPAGRAILFLHGGAYMLGSARSYRGFASQVAVRANVATFVLDYPLAPEHPFPTAPDAAARALAWLAGQGFPHIALVGDSAGGALALAALGAAPVASVVAFSPWVDLTLSGPSLHAPATHDRIFQRQVLAGAAATYLAGASPHDGRASPLFAVPASLPPLALQVGTDELLLDDARRYAAAASARGGIVTLDIYEGMHHVFQRATNELATARHALDAAARFIDTHWPGAR